jgi:hypothetical protein
VKGELRPGIGFSTRIAFLSETSSLLKIIKIHQKHKSVDDFSVLKEVW